MVLPLLALYAGAQVAGTFVNAYVQSEALKAEGHYQKMIGDYNARAERDVAKRLVERGEFQANETTRQAGAFGGLLRAQQAGGGLQLGFGTTKQIREEVAADAELDAFRIRKNAYLAAWGYEVQAIQSEYGGLFARNAARSAAQSLWFQAGLKALGTALLAGHDISQMGGTPPNGSGNFANDEVDVNGIGVNRYEGMA